jgi:hypothetical protein
VWLATNEKRIREDGVVHGPGGLASDPEDRSSELRKAFSFRKAIN